MKPRILILAMALSLALPAAALQQTQPPAKTAPKKEKKVWTNEDLEALRASPRLSTFGESTASGTPAETVGEAQPGAQAPTAPEEQQAARQKAEAERTMIERYQQRLASLREELAKIDDELRSVRNLRSSGKTSGQGIDFTKTEAGLNTEARVVQLEQRRRELLRQIDEVESEARRSGVAPGMVR